MQLRSKKKVWINRFRLSGPQTPQLRTDMPIKRSVDFDDIKESRQKLDRMDFLSSHFRRVENPVPVLVRPAGSPNADSRSGFHTGGPDVRRLARTKCGRGHPVRML